MDELEEAGVVSREVGVPFQFESVVPIRSVIEGWQIGYLQPTVKNCVGGRRLGFDLSCYSVDRTFEWVRRSILEIEMDARRIVGSILFVGVFCSTQRVVCDHISEVSIGPSSPHGLVAEKMRSECILSTFQQTNCIGPTS